MKKQVDETLVKLRYYVGLQRII